MAAADSTITSGMDLAPEQAAAGSAGRRVWGRFQRANVRALVA